MGLYDQSAPLSHGDLVAVMEEALSGMELPACISLVDSDGLVVYSIGNCLETVILESFNAYLIMSFESTTSKLESMNEILDYQILNTGDKSIYVDDLRGSEGLFIIVQAGPAVMTKILPFLKSFVSTVESAFERSLSVK
ncbi:MAG: hypothetical protein ACFFFG_05730 [Candidatus Thorarchaeota archaeon]